MLCCGKCGKELDKEIVIMKDGQVVDLDQYWGLLCPRCWGDYLRLLNREDSYLNLAVKHLWDKGAISERQATSLINKLEASA